MSAIPAPPVAEVYSGTTQAVFTSIVATAVVVTGYYCFRGSGRGKDWLPAVLFVGGFLGSLQEVVVDTLGLVWFPKQGNWVAWETFDRLIPIFVPLTYPFVFVGPAYYALTRFRKGIHSSDIWIMYGLFFLLFNAVEIPAIHAHAYFYYGDQPFRLFGYPLWWAVMNATICMLLAVMAFKIQPYVTGWKVLSALPLPAFAIGAVWMGTGLPTFLTLNNNELSPAANWAAATVTIGLCLLVIWFLRLALIPPVLSGATGAPLVSTRPVDEPTRSG